MSNPVRVQLSRAKGWRMPPNTVKCARPSRWGNPFPVKEFGLFLSLALFENAMRGFWSPSLFDGAQDLDIDLAYRLHCEFRKRHGHQPEAHVRELRGQNLACFCSHDQRCHVDLLLQMANETL
jgi:hypothetical protein